MQGSSDAIESKLPPERRVRADAQRNIDTLLRSALEVFVASGVDAPVREIAEKAGVGIGTVYRHFPNRSDLIAAVFRHEVDACADEAAVLANQHPPVEALGLWMQRFAAFIATKRGLAAALHSSDAAYESLPAYFCQRFRPALRSLLDAATEAGEIRSAVDPDDLLAAIASLSRPTQYAEGEHAKRMIALLVDGLRYGATPPPITSLPRTPNP